jgi:hypothetical protein
MRYWVHATVTIVLSVVLALAGLVVAVLVAIALPFDTPRILAWLAMIAGPALGLFLPPLMMSRISCVCPKCGGRARFGFAAFGNGFRPTYAYFCCDCDWSTYRWSAYWQRKFNRRM